MVGTIDNTMGQLDFSLPEMHISLNLDDAIITVSARREKLEATSRRQEIIPGIWLHLNENDQIISVRIMSESLNGQLGGDDG